ANHENADAAIELRKHWNVVGSDLWLAGGFLAAPMVRETPIEERQQIRPLGPNFFVHGETGGVLAGAAAPRLADAHQADDLREIDMERGFASARIATPALWLGRWGVVTNQTAQGTAGGLRPTPGQMGAERPRNRAAVT